MKRTCSLLLLICFSIVMAAPHPATAAEEKEAVATEEKEAEPVEDVQVVAGEKKKKDVKQSVGTYLSHVGNKLTIGAINVARSGTEFYFQPQEAKMKSGATISMLWPGLGEASGMFLTRLFAGIIDVVSSPLPFPKPDWEPLMNE